MVARTDTKRGNDLKFPTQAKNPPAIFAVPCRSFPLQVYRFPLPVIAVCVKRRLRHERIHKRNRFYST